MYDTVVLAKSLQKHTKNQTKYLHELIMILKSIETFPYVR